MKNHGSSLARECRNIPSPYFVYVKLSYGKLRWWDEPPAASTLSFHNEYEEAAWCDTITTNQNILYVRFRVCLGSVSVFFLKKLIVLFSKDTLNWSKWTVKTFIMLKTFYFELSIHQIILKKSRPITVPTEILSSTTVLYTDINKKCSYY